VLGLKLIGALAGAIVLNVLVAPLFGGARQTLIALASLSLVPDAFNAIVTSRIKARQRMGVSSAINLGTRLAYVLSGVLVTWSGENERTLLIMYVTSSALGSVAFGTVLWAWHIRPRWSALGQMWRGVLGESIPFAITGLAAILYTRLDLLMLSLWQGDVAAGLYGAAYRLWEALGMIPSSFLDAFFPELSKAGGSPESRARLIALYRRGQRILWTIVPLLVVPCLVAAPYLTDLIYGHTADTPVSAAIFRMLLLAFPFTYLYLLSGHALYAVGQQRRVTAVMVAVTAVAALGNALLIPRWSYWGAASMALAAEVALFGLLYGAARRAVLRPALEEQR
jgi:O-antigen/teichoic acid export membrane protein